MLELDPAKTATSLVEFLKENFAESGFAKAVVGLSGGIDSAVSTALTARALGVTNLYPVILPYGVLNSQDVLDAMGVVEWLKIPLSQVIRLDVKPIVEEITKNLKDPTIDNLRRGNLMARVRMSILFDQAKKRQALVVGTENKSEYLLGYFTRFGDEASDFEPLRNLYKTQVRQLAKFLGVPSRVQDKVPSAGLWVSQTDEQELGFSYKEADQVLHLIYDGERDPREAVKLGIAEATVKKILLRVKEMAFKHHLPYLPKEN